MIFSYPKDNPRDNEEQVSYKECLNYNTHVCDIQCIETRGNGVDNLSLVTKKMYCP